MVIKNFFLTVRDRGAVIAISASINLLRMLIENRLLGRKLIKRNIHQYKMYLDASDSGLCRGLILFGTREVDHKILLEKILKPGMTVLDIGANIGYYALMELDLIGSTGKLIAVEPSPSNLTILKKNLELNNISGVRIVNGAISDKSEKKDFYLAHQGNLNTFHATGTGAKHLNGEVIEVESFTVPEIMKDEGQLDLIRMDVEGHEVEVLNGMYDEIIKGNLNPTIIFETHLTRYGSDHNMSLTLKKYFEAGYKIKYLASSWQKGSEIVESRGYVGSNPIETDGVQRKIYSDVSDIDGIDFICNTGGARTVVLKYSKASN